MCATTVIWKWRIPTYKADFLIAQRFLGGNASRVFFRDLTVNGRWNIAARSQLFLVSSRFGLETAPRSTILPAPSRAQIAAPIDTNRATIVISNRSTSVERSVPDIVCHRASKSLKPISLL